MTPQPELIEAAKAAATVELAFGDIEGELNGVEQASDEQASDEQAVVTASLGWQREFAPAALLWAVATALVAGAAWLAGRLWRRVPAYAMAVPPSLLTLFYCFANLEKFIPAV